MTYVDLNPIRAGLSTTPETSTYTSIQERLQSIFHLSEAIKGQSQCGDLLDFKTPLKPLLHFQEKYANQSYTGILFTFKDYLELLDWTCRILRDDKPGYIDNKLPPILQRLSIPLEQWRLNATQFEAVHPKRFNRIASNIDTG